MGTVNNSNVYRELLERQQAYFRTDITKTYEWRIQQLTQLERMLQEHTPAFMQALGQDFKTALVEQVFEVAAPPGVSAATRAQLQGWMQPQEAPLPKFMAATGHQGMIYREPYGACLIMGPFNAPLLSLINPAIAALSAGNTVVLKTHEATPATSALLAQLVPQYFAPEAVTVVTGDKDASAALLALPFDFIFFTGSPRVGKIVMRAAAEHLTPVILELGGQNPAIIDQTADIADAARKLAWGATAWGGQWCTSPGYAYVHESVVDEFIREAKKALQELYGDDPKHNPDYTRIISEKETARLAALIDPAKVVYGGDADTAARYVAPTLLYPVQFTDKIMEEEIFGPILPIITFKNLQEAVHNIKQIAKPLSCFVFSQDKTTVDYLLNTLSFGGGAVNQTNIHVFLVTMPFGGVGNSGMGNFYGKYGFDALTHAKSVLKAPAGIGIDHLLPPYNMEKVQALNSWFDY